MNGSDIRAWAANHRAGSARERMEARRHRLNPADAFASALALLVFDELQNGSPFERIDPVSDREDEQMRAAWTKLRERGVCGR